MTDPYIVDIGELACLQIHRAGEIQSLVDNVVDHDSEGLRRELQGDGLILG